MNNGTSFYDVLAATTDRSESLQKKASVKDAGEIKSELEVLGFTGEKIEVLAGSIMGIFSKTAAEVAEEVMTPQETVPAAAPTLEDNMAGDEEAAALEVVKAKAADVVDAVDTLEAVKDTAVEDVVEADPAIGEQVAVDPAVAGDQTGAKEVTASEKEDSKEDSKEDEKKEDSKEDEKKEDAKEEDSEEDDSEDSTKADIQNIIDNGTEEEKEALASAAYDQVIVKMANHGVTLFDYVLSQVEDEHLANEIATRSYQLSKVAGVNYVRVADEIIGSMEKIASEAE